MNVVILNGVWHEGDRTPDEALDRFTTLTGWAEAVRDAGAEVCVIQRFHHDARLVRTGIPYEFVADTAPAHPPFWFGGGAMLTALPASRPSVVHVNGLDHPRVIRGIRRALPDAAIAVQDHGGFEPAALSLTRRWGARYLLAAANVLFVATPQQAEAFRASGVVPDGTTVRDVMEGSTELRCPGRSEQIEGLRVLWVGRLNANKDPLTVLEGFSRFAEAHPNATLTYIYGTSELESALRAGIVEHHLEGRVTMAGSVSHNRLVDFYANADVFVLGSRREGSGYAALEAMACGVVPILTGIPAFRGLTDEGRVGGLWKAGDPASLAAALTRAASAPLAEQRDACRRRFEQHFSWKAIGARAMAIYRDCSVG